jgi:hypothetical protein
VISDGLAFQAFSAEYITNILETRARSLSAQNGEKGKTGRPKGGLSEAARNMPGKGTESAKRHKIEQAAKVRKIDPEVRQKILDAGLADKPTKLCAIAKEKDKAAQLKKLQQLTASSGKSRADASGKSAGADQSPFEVLKREWKPTKQWLLAWESASWSDQRQFVNEVLDFLWDDDD